MCFEFGAISSAAPRWLKLLRTILGPTLRPVSEVKILTCPYIRLALGRDRSKGEYTVVSCIFLSKEVSQNFMLPYFQTQVFRILPTC